MSLNKYHSMSSRKRSQEIDNDENYDTFLLAKKRESKAVQLLRNAILAHQYSFVIARRSEKFWLKVQIFVNTVKCQLALGLEKTAIRSRKTNYCIWTFLALITKPLLSVIESTWTKPFSKKTDKIESTRPLLSVFLDFRDPLWLYIVERLVAGNPRRR